jgi:hypothetical protein
MGSVRATVSVPQSFGKIESPVTVRVEPFLRVMSIFSALPDGSADGHQAVNRLCGGLDGAAAVVQGHGPDIGSRRAHEVGHAGAVLAVTVLRVHLDRVSGERLDRSITSAMPWPALSVRQ